MKYPSEVEGFSEECNLCIETEVAFQNTSDRRTHNLIIGNLERHCKSEKHRNYRK